MKEVLSRNEAVLSSFPLHGEQERKGEGGSGGREYSGSEHELHKLQLMLGSYAYMTICMMERLNFSKNIKKVAVCFYF